MKFSTCFLFSLQNATRRKWILLLFWIEIVIVISSFIMTKGVVNYYQGEWEVLSGFSGDSCILLSSNQNYRYLEDEVAKMMQTDSNIKAIGCVRQLSPLTMNNASFDVVAFDDVILNHCQIPLSKGSQITQNEKIDGVIPVIVGSQAAKTYQYGQTYTLSYAGEMKIKVVGVLDSSNAYLGFGGGGTDIFLQVLIQRNPNVLIFSSSHLSDQPIAKAMNFKDNVGNTSLVEIQETQGKAFENTCENLSLVGYPNKAWEVKETSLRDAANAILPHLMKLLVVLIACLVGMYGYNLFKQNDNLRKNSIIYLCGGTNRNFVGIQIIEACITLIPPAIAGAIYGCCKVLYQTEEMERSFILFRSTDPIWVLVILVLIYSISYLPHIIHTMKSHPIDMIRRFE